MLTTPSVHFEQACICGHWPLDAPGHIQAAALDLQALSKAWDGAHDLLEGGASGSHACRDVAVIPLDDLQYDVLQFQAALVPDRVLAIVTALSALERDFGSVKEWLVSSARDACLAKEGAHVGLTVVRDDHRVIARDWLAADMNAMIAWLLRRAIRTLTRLDLSPDAVRADIFGAHQYQEAMLAVAAILEHAALLAQQSAAYVEGFNHQWLELRAHVAVANALCPLNEAPFQAAGNAPANRGDAPHALAA